MKMIDTTTLRGVRLPCPPWITPDPAPAPPSPSTAEAGAGHMDLAPGKPERHPELRRAFLDIIATNPGIRRLDIMIKIRHTPGRVVGETVARNTLNALRRHGLIRVTKIHCVRHIWHLCEMPALIEAQERCAQLSTSQSRGLALELCAAAIAWQQQAAREDQGQG